MHSLVLLVLVRLDSFIEIKLHKQKIFNSYFYYNLTLNWIITNENLFFYKWYKHLNCTNLFFSVLYQKNFAYKQVYGLVIIVIFLMFKFD